jgi:poly(hydroxyalkanoate) depolymerase family esterase
VLKIPAEILEATRLTRAGRLADATAAIQRALRRPAARPSADEADPARISIDGAIDGDYRVIEVERRSPVIPGPRPSETREGGRFIQDSFANHAGARGYKLYIPGGYRGEPLPMVVMLHGCKQTPDDFAAGTRMNALAEEAGCLVLYPAQSRGANGSRCWNWFKRADQQPGEGEPAIIAGMTEELARRHGIDRRRVFVAGLSAGGAMAAVMGRTYPTLYAGISVHSGIAYAIAHDLPSALAAMRGGGGRAAGTAARAAATSTVPTIVFHGDRDAVVHPSNADRLVASSRMSYEHGARQGPANPRVTVERGRAPGGHAYTRAIYRDPDGQMLLENWTIHGAGHAWSGGSASGSFTDPKGPDATREMLRFFGVRP